jgi:protein-disulfide isomerase
MSLTSAPVPPLRDDDHVRGPDDAPLVVMYADFACPYCALAHARLRDSGLRVAFRHFALRAKHPRAPALAAAAEAAALQGAFWPLHDALYADQGRQDDPHLWDHARALGLDVERFERDRRGDGAAARVKRDVRDALRAGVATTPTLVIAGALHAGPPAVAILRKVRNDEKQEGAADPTGGPREDNSI